MTPQEQAFWDEVRARFGGPAAEALLARKTGRIIFTVVPDPEAQSGDGEKPTPDDSPTRLRDSNHNDDRA